MDSSNLYSAFYTAVPITLIILLLARQALRTFEGDKTIMSLSIGWFFKISREKSKKDRKQKKSSPSNVDR